MNNHFVELSEEQRIAIMIKLDNDISNIQSAIKQNEDECKLWANSEQLLYEESQASLIFNRSELEKRKKVLHELCNNVPITDIEFLMISTSVNK